MRHQGVGAIAVLAFALPGCGARSTIGVGAAVATTSTTPSRHSGVMTLAPDSGPAGTVVSISGKGCSQAAVETSQIDVIVNLTGPRRQKGFASAHVPVRADGSWSGTLTVPGSASVGRYVVNGMCLMQGDELIFEYPSVPFGVTASRPTTSMPTTIPTPSSLPVTR